MVDRSLRFALAALCMLAATCGGDAKKSDGDAAKVSAGAAAADSAPAKSAEEGEPADEGNAPDDGKAADGGKSTDGGEAADDGKTTEGKATGGKAADEGKADEGKADGATGGAAPVDPAPLLDEVKAKKTTDERALAALAAAESAGAELRDVAKAANGRGEKLFDKPERAKVFFEWAAAKDPKYPEPAFNLAKQAAVQGEVDLAKEWLVKTHERGGKKLLKQIGFDPMWEIVKDDPDIRKLYE